MALNRLYSRTLVLLELRVFIPQVLTQMGEKVDIPLSRSTEWAFTLEKVTIRRPVMRDMIRHNVDLDMSIQDSVNLIADLCNLVFDELEEMDTCDFEKLQKQLLAFRGMD